MYKKLQATQLAEYLIDRQQGCSTRALINLISWFTKCTCNPPVLINDGQDNVDDKAVGGKVLIGKTSAEIIYLEILERLDTIW